MILELFVLLDILTAVILFLAQFGLVKKIILFYHASYLLLKAFWYYKDWFTWIDGLIGVYLLLMMFGLQIAVVTYAAIGFFVYKTLTLFLYRS